jgi:uncharacterized FlaG/YvyC family protein
MISNISFVPDATIQTARKPDVATSPVGVTGASTSTAPQSDQAVKTLIGTEKVRDQQQSPFADDEQQKAAEAEAEAEKDTRFEVSLDQATGRRVFKRVVASNGHVLWQEPEEKVLERAREMKQSTGLFTDKSV